MHERRWDLVGCLSPQRGGLEVGDQVYTWVRPRWRDEIQIYLFVIFQVHMNCLLDCACRFVSLWMYHRSPVIK